MKTFQRTQNKQRGLEDLDCLPKRESIRSNIKEFGDYWNYWERNKSNINMYFTYLNRLTEKYKGKPTKEYIKKIKGHPRSKTYAYKSCAKQFLDNVINKPTYTSWWHSVVSIEGIVQPSTVLALPFVLYPKYKYHLKFIKWHSKKDTLLCYVIIKDEYYIAKADYSNVYKLPFQVHFTFRDLKDIKRVDKETQLDLEYYLKGLENES